MEYEYSETIKFKGSKVRLVSDKDGCWFVRKNTHIDSKLAEKLIEISCPRIVKFIEFGEDDDGEYVIEEYVEGVTAAERSFTGKQAVKVLLELCDALEALHSAKIVHRDIKPSNIIIMADGHIKLIDFDASRIEKTVKDKDTQILGTEGFAPPEQFGFSQTDNRSDIYSFGVTMNMILGEKSAPFINIIKKCKALDPNDRYDSISKVKTAIRLAVLKRFAAIPAAAILLVIFTTIFSTVLKQRDQIDFTGDSYLGSYISSVPDTTQPLPVDSQLESSNGSDNSLGKSDSEEPSNSSQTSTNSYHSESNQSSQVSETMQSSEPSRSSSSKPTESSKPPQSSEPPRSSEPTQSSQTSQTSEPAEVSQPSETSNGFYQTVKNEYGYYTDVCDYVFNDDSSVHGAWTAIGTLEKTQIKSFIVGRIDCLNRTFKDLPIQNVTFNADGSATVNMESSAKWTKYYFILRNSNGQYVEELLTANVKGAEYIMIEDKTDGYAKTGLSEKYIVFMKSNANMITYTTYLNSNGNYIDECTYVYYSDPSVYGNWEIFGLVKAAYYDKWLNGTKELIELDDAWMRDLEIYPEGDAVLNGKMKWKWTNGYIVHEGKDATVSALFTVTVGGTEYLVVENKNGDYNRNGSITSYLVFTRKEG